MPDIAEILLLLLAYHKHCSLDNVDMDVTVSGRFGNAGTGYRWACER